MGMLAALAPADVLAGDGLDVAMGKALFERQWVAAPASTDAADGLGPLFNARSCSGCHAGGGPARFVQRDGGWQVQGLVMRVAGEDGAPHAALGHQLQTRSVPGLAAEARISVTVSDSGLATSVQLTSSPDEPARFAPRLAPSLHGRGLLEQVDEVAVLALADPDDRDGDGISGRAHMVDDGSGDPSLGRYGSKAKVPSLIMQTAGAAALDIGLSSPLVLRPHGDCTPLQADCLARPTGRSAAGDGEEISTEVVRLIATYVASLDAPRPDLSSPGFRLFTAAGCAACHVPEMPGRNRERLTVFSDLLLHDLGPGLASPTREGDAAPQEWRTAPLRDLDPAGGTRRYLNGGQAASLAEAIALHGGEAMAARQFFMESGKDEQAILIEFLSGL